MKKNGLIVPLSYEQITKILPHKYPFLFIDKVVEFTDNKRLVAYKNLTNNEFFFQGHFPKNPIMPGVLQVEALAQASGILAYLVGHHDPAKKEASLVGIECAKFKKPVFPGDRLFLEVYLDWIKKGFYRVSGTCMVDGECVSVAVITNYIRDKEKA